MTEYDPGCDLDEAIRRIKTSLETAYYAKTSAGGPVDTVGRQLMVSIAEAYTDLARVLQTERDYEERKIREISEQHDEPKK